MNITDINIFQAPHADVPIGSLHCSIPTLHWASVDLQCCTSRNHNSFSMPPPPPNNVEVSPHFRLLNNSLNSIAFDSVALPSLRDPKISTFFTWWSVLYSPKSISFNYYFPKSILYPLCKKQVHIFYFPFKHSQFHVLCHGMWLWNAIKVLYFDINIFNNCVVTKSNS